MELPTDAYARSGDKFITVAYRSDYTESWHTCLRVDGHYVRSTDTERKSERDARLHAVLCTGDDNGRGLQPCTDAENAWIQEGAE